MVKEIVQMKHHRYNPDFNFVVSPMEFDKYTSRHELQYCLGACMYMPGTKDFVNKILSDAMPALTSMVLCFEDACPEDDVPTAENNALLLLERLSAALDTGEITYKTIPLIFCRVRNIKQFRHFAERLERRHIKVLAGFNFPKFNTQNGEVYFNYLSELNDKLGEILYGMPIIEDAIVAYKESRMDELLGVRQILEKYRELVLQVRVGATDFSSCFGFRRGIDSTIYDIMPVSECLSDIMNVFGRNNDYVVSGPVWEYFHASKEMMFQDLPQHNIHESLLKRVPIFNDAVDGLLREVILDRANGFVGKTVIHPTHVKFVNAMQAVTEEEFDDAQQVLSSRDGGRRTVVDLLGNVTERVYPVGRLDYDSCGLLLLTNDGELAQRLIHPRYQVKKVYRVVVDGFPTKEDVNHWSQGVMLEDGPTLPARVERLRTRSGGTELLFELHEGRNRQIRRMCAALGYQVVSLCRIGMGPLTLGRLSAGRSRRLTDIELGNLRRAVGLNEA
jgi:pseudouridine synthase